MARLGLPVPREADLDHTRLAQSLQARRPDHLWQTDITHVYCGANGWCYCFNIIDVFGRMWLACVLDTTARLDGAIQSVVDAVAEAAFDCTRLMIHTDNGVRYTSRRFRDTLKRLGIRHGLIAYKTLEQNGT